MLPKPPAEPKRISDLSVLAPRFKAAVDLILADVKGKGFNVMVFESLRTNERQKFLYGFGREYDDGRGPVTKAATAEKGWHLYGLAVDIVENDASPWTASQALWQAIGHAAEAHGCTWGGRWHVVDLPHVQWGNCPQSPSSDDIALFRASGRSAVWAEYAAG